MVSHSFGLVAAVYNYNRRSAAITDVLRRLFKVGAFDFMVITILDTALRSVKLLSRLSVSQSVFTSGLVVGMKPRSSTPIGHGSHDPGSDR